jgi:hypothetical protein
MVTGIRPKTFKNLVLNAGAFLEGFDWKTYKTVEELENAVIAALLDDGKTFGATIGGGSFQLAPTARQIEADGKRYEFVGSTVFDSWSVKMTGTLKEVTPGNFERILPTAEVTKNGNVTSIRVRTKLEDEDYIPSFVWVGDTSEGFILIELENVLNTTGANMTFTDKGEATLPFEFTAHKKDVSDMDEAPVTIVFFDQESEE